jgi:hypothetical protein
MVVHSLAASKGTEEIWGGMEKACKRRLGDDLGRILAKYRHGVIEYLGG